MRYPIYLQDDRRSCGIYCLKMILKYYGIDEDVIHLKVKAHVDNGGTTIKGLVETLKSYNIESTAYKAALKKVLEEAKLPCILHLIQGNFGHFVVLYEISEQECLVGDPASGLIHLEYKELEEMYSGFVITIKHIGRYFQYEEKSYKTFLKMTYKMYKREIRSLVRFALMLSVFHFIAALMSGIMIDYLKVKTPLVLSGIIVLAYFISSSLRVLVDSVKEKKMVLLTRSLDKEYVYRSIVNTLHLPEYLFRNDLGMMHAKLQNLYHLSSYSVKFYEALIVDGMVSVLLMISLLFISFPLAILAMLLLMVIVLYVRFRSQRLYVLYKDYIEKHNKNDSTLYEFLKSRELTRRYLGRRKAIKKYEHVYEEEADALEDKDISYLHMTHMIQFINITELSIILLAGLFLYHHNALSLGSLFVFYTLFSLLLNPILTLTTVFIEYKENSILYEQYKEFMVKEVDGEKSLDESIHTIRFDDVTYGYGYHNDVLNHLDLTINHNLFITGANGSGKSTMFYLLRGLDYEYKGRLLVNDIPLHTIIKSSLFSHIGYCGEYGEFIGASVLENLGDYTYDEVIDVLHLIEADKLIEKLDCVMEENGAPLSQGERQLLSIARCLLKRSDVYLFDESFSHISFAKAKRIIHKMMNVYSKSLFIIITHNTNLMNKGEEYAIIEGGKVKEIRIKK